MKKIILFLIFILTVQICYKISPVGSQEDKYTVEIMEVLKNFFKSCTYLDIDSAMQFISPNYSERADNIIIDYAKYKSRLENSFNLVSKIYVDSSFNDLEILKSNIQDKSAAVEIRFSFKGFNLNTLKEDEIRRSGIVTLEKENGVWEIIQSNILREKNNTIH